MTPHVVLFGRPGCCLCDEARELLERVRESRPFELEERDIEADEQLLRAYLERIPVITIDGVERLELLISEEDLVRALDAPRSPGAASRVDDG